MLAITRRLPILTWLVALLGLTLAVDSAHAQAHRDVVRDEAGLFSATAKDQAQAEIAKIQKRFKKELIVETVAQVKLPGDLNLKDPVAVNRHFDDWAARRFDSDKVNGIYVVIVQEPAKVRIRVGVNTQKQGLFTTADRQDLEKLVIAKLQESRKDPAARDAALVGAAKLVFERMSKNTTATAQSNKPAVVAALEPVEAPAEPEPRTNWVTYVVIGVGIFLVLWLVMAVIRGLSSMGAGGAAGGGGGFLNGFLGGLFGVMAGMWVYNTFFGGHANTAHAADPTSSPDAGDATDAGAGSTGGGGDWGDTDAGGDAGGDMGGGDWGGGDFGGGDMGGGDW